MSDRDDGIRRAQALLADGLHYARGRGLKVCVGFEVTGDPTTPEAQEHLAARLTALIRALAMRYPIAAITGHEHVAPGRKQDPGPGFDWPRLRQTLDWPPDQIGPA